MTNTFTVCKKDGTIIERYLSKIEAMDAILCYDTNDYKIEKENENYVLYVTTNSKASYVGWKWIRSKEIETSNYKDAVDHFADWIINNTFNWVISVYTVSDNDYDEMLREMICDE